MRHISLLLTLLLALVGCGNHAKTSRDAPYLSAQGVWIFPNGQTLGNPSTAPGATPAAPLGGATGPQGIPADPSGPLAPVGGAPGVPTPVGLPGDGGLTPVAGGLPTVGGAGALGGAGGLPTAPVGVSFAQMIQPIFTANCTTCHGAGGTSPVLTTGSAYEAIVRRPSGQSGLNLVEPGNTALSYLFRKVAGTHLGVGGSGARMPLNMPQLVQNEVDLLQAWIDAGAPNN